LLLAEFLVSGNSFRTGKDKADSRSLPQKATGVKAANCLTENLTFDVSLPQGVI
jgi:hypothetical protein